MHTTDTELNLYDAHRGFQWAHMGQMTLKPRHKIGVADVSDLSRKPVVRWQHHWYVYLIIRIGLLMLMVVADLVWGDWAGRFFYARGSSCLSVLFHYVSKLLFSSAVFVLICSSYSRCFA